MPDTLFGVWLVSDDKVNERVAALEARMDEQQRQSRRLFSLVDDVKTLLSEIGKGLAVNIAADKIRFREMDGVGEKLDQVIASIAVVSKSQEDFERRVENLENVSRAYVRVIEVIGFFSSPTGRRFAKWLCVILAGLFIFFFDDARMAWNAHTNRSTVVQEVPKLKDE
ncbi:hypothetical protein [Terasakiella sp.]|uniref:hypothetical protein n=1 Tax=Terasakiella sp. TaxID=2034861 RepID=UPI003AA986F1